MKYAAMIRGIGPANPNMRGDKLVEAFTSCGFSNVRAFLGSGNVLFESDITDTTKLEQLAEVVLPRLLGFERDVLIRSQADFQALADATPFGNRKHENSGKTYLTVTFFKTPPKDLPPLPYIPEGKPFEVVAFINGALCCVVDLEAGKTPDLMVWLDRQFTKRITTRTWSSVTRMLAKLENSY
jgi:uncharacterized protein (DUF1697 family)